MLGFPLFLSQNFRKFTALVAFVAFRNSLINLIGISFNLSKRAVNLALSLEFAGKEG